jgi:hypothetical protein
MTCLNNTLPGCLANFLSLPHNTSFCVGCSNVSTDDDGSKKTPLPPIVVVVEVVAAAAAVEAAAAVTVLGAEVAAKAVVVAVVAAVLATLAPLGKENGNMFSLLVISLLGCFRLFFPDRCESMALTYGMVWYGIRISEVMRGRSSVYSSSVYDMMLPKVVLKVLVVVVAAAAARLI